MDQLENEHIEQRPRSMLARVCEMPWAGFTVISLGSAMLGSGLAGLEPFFGMLWANIFHLAAGACFIVMAALVPVTLTIWLVGKSTGHTVSLRPNAGYRATATALFVLGIVFAGLPMYVTGWMKAREAAANADTTPWQRIQIGDKRVTIDLPSSYNPIDRLVNPANGIAYGNPSGDFTVFAIAMPIADTATTSLEVHAALTIEQYLKNIEGSEISYRFSGDFSDATNGLESVRYRLVYQLNGQAYTEHIDFHPVGEQFVELRLVGPSSRFFDYSEDINGILLSLKRMIDE